MRTTIITAMILLLSSNIFSQESFVSKRLEKVWTTKTGLNVPESSHYNNEDHLIYVSNVVGKYNIKDGIGFISKLNEKGEFVEKEWVRGLNAPKGIDCTKTKLYVTDIDRVVEVDLKSGKIVSDSEGNCIFYVGKDSLEVFLESNELESMNGIYVKDNLLYLGSKGNFISIDQNTKTINVLAKKVGYLDGIEQIAPNVFVTSDWSGKIQLIIPGKGIEKMLDSSSLKINAADLGYIPSKKLLLVPTFSDNHVVAYKLDFE